MPITVTWDDAEKTVLLLDFTGKWTWTDYDAARTTVYTTLDPVKHRVAMIVDFHDSQYVPHDILMHARHALDTSHPALDTYVLVGANTFLRHIYQLLERAFPLLTARHAVLFAGTREDARAQLAAYRQQSSEPDRH